MSVLLVVRNMANTDEKHEFFKIQLCDCPLKVGVSDFTVTWIISSVE